MKHINTAGKILLIAAAIFITIHPAQAAVFEIQRVASNDSLNLRAKPGAKSAVVGRIPHNGKWIRTDGRRVAVGRTNWVKITWQGRTGWVNENYIRQMKTSNNPQQPASQPQRPRPPAPQATPEVRPPPITAASLQKKGAWVLECGDLSPFWRVIVHPGKALDVNLRGRNAGILPLTYQKQKKNKWNTAMKTVVKSSNGHFATDMTIRYTKQCFHTLAKQSVRYKVKAQVNGEQMEGCCRAIQLR